MSVFAVLENKVLRSLFAGMKKKNQRPGLTLSREITMGIRVGAN